MLRGKSTDQGRLMTREMTGNTKEMPEEQTWHKITDAAVIIYLCGEAVPANPAVKVLRLAN